MVTRTRNANIPAPPGIYERRNSLGVWVLIDSNDGFQQVDSIVDVVATGDNHALDIRHDVIKDGILNGVADRDRFTNFRFRQLEYGNYLHQVISAPSDGAMAAKLLALTNPSRSVVDLPIFVAELREFPKLFKLAGDNLLKKGASANLSYQFGWKPLINDLKGMLDFHDHVAKRRKEIEALYSSGLKRTRSLWSDSLSTQISVTDSPGSGWTYRLSKTTSLSISGHVKWKPIHNFPKTDKEMARLARKAVFGLTIDPSTAWELIPFSWLVDWCSSTGDYLIANRNIIPCTYHDLSIMRHTVTKVTSITTAGPRTGITGTPPTIDRERKQRAPTAGPTISAHLPGLSLRQLSILGSIALLRR